jgi:hypothetical protein
MLRDEARPISVLKLDQKLTTRHGKKKREQFLSVLRPTLTNTTMIVEKFILPTSVLDPFQTINYD